MSEELHAKYAPSAAARWMTCPGSIALSEKVANGPEQSSKYADEGTECHEATAAFLRNEVNAGELLIGLSEEQVNIVKQYVDYCWNLKDRLVRKFGADNVQWWVEERCHAPAISPDFSGTPDFVIHAGNTFAVVDLKSGYTPVSVENNPQLLSYALLTLEHHRLWDRVKEVRMTVIQPRIYDKPQTWTVSATKIFTFLADVKRAILQTDIAKDTLVAGAHCKYCPARGRCPELRKEVIKQAQIDFDEPREARDYEAEELAAIAKEAEFIKFHLDGVMQHIRSMLERGRKVPGWKLVPKRAVSKWTDFEGFLAEMPEGERERFFIAKPMTPGQARSCLEEGAWDFDLSPYFVKESSGTTLAKDSDPREKVQHDPFGD